MKTNYDQLIAKISEFTKKFYLNKLLRGSIYALGMILALYLLMFLISYYFNPHIGAKTILFFSFITIGCLSIFIWVVKPVLLYLKLGKNLTIEQSAKLIGDHFFNVKDKLLNTLQLKALAEKNPENSLLIIASIDQKIDELSPVPFAQAIRLTENKKYIKYFLAPLSVILLIGLIAPGVIKEGTNRFVQYDKEILPVAPFKFFVNNKKLLFIQGEDATVSLKLDGNEIPQDVYINDGLNTYKLEKKSKTEFFYIFKNIQSSKKISFVAGGFNSQSYTLLVSPRPSIVGITAHLKYPLYLNKAGETIHNAGDMLLPEGTAITWKIKTENSSELTFLLGMEKHKLLAKNGEFSFTRAIKQNSNYMVAPKNSLSNGKDSLRHQINVIKDEYPSINIIESPDSLSNKILYFTGKVSDDHGFTALVFVVNVKENGVLKRVIKKAIPIKRNQLESAFMHTWNFVDEEIKGGQSLEYFFQISDNDGVNNPKSANSEIKIFDVPTPRQIADKINASSLSLKKQMEKAIKLAGDVSKESKKLTETLLDKKRLSNEDKKEIEQLLSKQKQLENAIEDIKKQNEKNTFSKQENNALKEELAEKQKQIDELFNNVLDDKTKTLLQKLQELMDHNNKDQTQNELSKMQMDNKTLKNELDRILELYKQLEFEQNLQNNIDQLKGLAEKQKELAKKTLDKNQSTEALKAEQKKLEEEFKELKKDLEKLAEKNSQMERPNAFENPKEESSKVDEQQKNSENNLQKGNKNEASKSQQKAAEELNKMADKMEEMQQQSSESENTVNAQELRRLLENLLKTSFDQEKVMLSLRAVNSNDPLYTGYVQKQRNIKDNLKTISDSLFSLSKRVPQIQTAVNEEMQKINFNVDKSLENLGERNTPNANRNQQYAMTSINNLSLMLSEALDQLQNAMKNAKGGKGKTGNMRQLQQMQQQLNNNMQQAREQMRKNGNQGKVPKGQMSQEFAKMAQQQQMIREAMQKLSREQNKDGKNGAGGLNKMIDDMKATESDLVNKTLQQQTLDRQKKLLEKMLDAENAEREEEEDAKREAKAAKEFPPSYKIMMERFKLLQKSETEWLQKLPPNLNHYYKNKVTEYFKLLNSPK